VARLPRLAVAGHAHLVSLWGHSGQRVFLDDVDRKQFLAALRESSLQHKVAILAYVLLDDRVHLVLVPEQAAALGAVMQGLGRRYGAGFNRRHGRHGSLWDGRYRAAVMQPGETVLQAMVFIDGMVVSRGLAEQPQDHGWSSARHHLGEWRDGLTSDGPAWWSLGNTPFEREAQYRARLQEGLSPERTRALEDASRKAWALGDAGFLASLADGLERPVQPRPRGRPRKAPAATAPAR